MCGRESKSPTWFAVIVAVLFVFGGYFIWRGFLSWADANFSFTAPSPAAPSISNSAKTVTAQTNVIAQTMTFAARPSPTSSCQQFRVKVLRARVRECPKDTCNTIALPEQGAVFCVYRLAPQTTDWYEVNLKPDDPIGELGYMSVSVLSPVNPTPRPSPTLNLATVTLVPTPSPSPSFAPPATNTRNPTIAAP